MGADLRFGSLIKNDERSNKKNFKTLSYLPFAGSDDRKDKLEMNRNLFWISFGTMQNSKVCVEDRRTRKALEVAELLFVKEPGIDVLLGKLLRPSVVSSKEWRSPLVLRKKISKIRNKQKNKY